MMGDVFIGASITVLSTMLVLAHQSDWVTMVLVFIPLGAFAAMLAVANKRADRDGLVDMTPPPKPDRKAFDKF